eukprot:Nitzschia sp. Nitz4//scaffold95_size97785//76862//81842//NITZ4_004677-RA/size97785-snap-gene-0.53-mRNA-1//-1//CDS//3329560502//5434//frame0
MWSNARSSSSSDILDQVHFMSDEGEDYDDFQDCEMNLGPRLNSSDGKRVFQSFDEDVLEQALREEEEEIAMLRLRQSQQLFQQQQQQQQPKVEDSFGLALGPAPGSNNNNNHHHHHHTINNIYRDDFPETASFGVMDIYDHRASFQLKTDNPLDVQFGASGSQFGDLSSRGGASAMLHGMEGAIYTTESGGEESLSSHRSNDQAPWPFLAPEPGKTIRFARNLTDGDHDLDPLMADEARIARLHDEYVKNLEIFDTGKKGGDSDEFSIDLMDDDNASYMSAVNELEEEDEIHKTLIAAITGTFSMAAINWAIRKTLSIFDKTVRETFDNDAGGILQNGGGDGGAYTGTSQGASAMPMDVSQASMLQASQSSHLGGAFVPAGGTGAEAQALQSMASNAAGNAASGAANASSAMASSAAAAAGAAAAGASMATLAVAVAAAVGVAGIATVASVGGDDSSSAVTKSLIEICTPGEAISNTGRVRIGFGTDALPSKTKMQGYFEQAYNEVTPGCDEAYERQLLSAKLEEVAIREPFGLNTYWSASVSCYPYCPEEPLFGTSGNATDTDSETRALRRNLRGNQYISFQKFLEVLMSLLGDIQDGETFYAFMFNCTVPPCDTTATDNQTVADFVNLWEEAPTPQPASQPSNPPILNAPIDTSNTAQPTAKDGAVPTFPPQAQTTRSPDTPTITLNPAVPTLPTGQVQPPSTPSAPSPTSDNAPAASPVDGGTPTSTGSPAGNPTTMPGNTPTTPTTGSSSPAPGATTPTPGNPTTDSLSPAPNAAPFAPTIGSSSPAPGATPSPPTPGNSPINSQSPVPSTAGSPTTTVSPTDGTTVSPAPSTTGSPTTTVSPTDGSTVPPTPSTTGSPTTTVSPTDGTTAPSTTGSPTTTVSPTDGTTVSPAPSTTGSPTTTVSPTDGTTVSPAPSTTGSPTTTVSPTDGTTVSPAPSTTGSPTTTVSPTDGTTVSPAPSTTGSPTTTVSPTDGTTVSPAPSTTGSPTTTVSPTDGTTVSPAPSTTGSPTTTVSPTDGTTVSPAPSTTGSPTTTVSPTDGTTVSPAPSTTGSPTTTVSPTDETTVSPAPSTTGSPTTTVSPTDGTTVSSNPTVVPSFSLSPTLSEDPTTSSESPSGGPSAYMCETVCSGSEFCAGTYQLEGVIIVAGSADVVSPPLSTGEFRVCRGGGGDCVVPAGFQSVGPSFSCRSENGANILYNCTLAATATSNTYACGDGNPTASPTYEVVTCPDDGESGLCAMAPSKTPSSVPSKTPSVKPSEVPSSSPVVGSIGITFECPIEDAFSETFRVPSESPSSVPSKTPSVKPSEVPSSSPVAVPSEVPSSSPFAAPSVSPTSVPSNNPSLKPSEVPSTSPLAAPSVSPTSVPSKTPSVKPSEVPSASPVVVPSAEPSASPSLAPVTAPSKFPTSVPSKSPTVKPSASPSLAPVTAPSKFPTSVPSKSPTVKPSASPSLAPVTAPSKFPTSVPSKSPTMKPSPSPSVATDAPSKTPTVKPSPSPSAATDSPSKSPTVKPVVVATPVPVDTWPPTKSSDFCAYDPVNDDCNSHSRGLGCYADRSSRDFEHEATPDFTSPDSCRAYCLSNSYAYAAMQGGTRCFCSVSPPDYPENQRNQNGKCVECNYECGNNKPNNDNSNTCGGFWANCVYYSADS